MPFHLNAITWLLTKMDCLSGIITFLGKWISLPLLRLFRFLSPTLTQHRNILVVLIYTPTEYSVIFFLHGPFSLSIDITLSKVIFVLIAHATAFLI